MRHTAFTPAGDLIAWTEAAGEGPARVYVHGLGAACAPYHAHVAADPALAGRRSLFVDLPGHGLSDRPRGFGYTLEDHARALGRVLDAAGIRGAEVVGHSMGGSVAVVLAHHRPELVSRLVLAEPNLDPDPPATAGSSGIARYTEEEFVHGGGMARTLERVGPVWRATMRLADPTALHRSAVGLVRGTRPTMRRLLTGLGVPRTLLTGALSPAPAGRAELAAAGVRLVTVPGAGHNIMFDNPAGYTAAIAARP
ncbi:alpha/beta fold hydrolase [Streptomyces pactum]|uniref:alpha/beta fold hydrolase n=1 Tax=Streptomyces pactum TaxID=68249 RepID=UPI0027DD01D7|nr:alpha/beta hydrolase [Streptomyces pactum]